MRPVAVMGYSCCLKSAPCSSLRDLVHSAENFAAIHDQGIDDVAGTVTALAWSVYSSPMIRLVSKICVRARVSGSPVVLTCPSWIYDDPQFEQVEHHHVLPFSKKKLDCSAFVAVLFPAVAFLARSAEKAQCLPCELVDPLTYRIDSAPN